MRHKSTSFNQGVFFFIYLFLPFYKKKELNYYLLGRLFTEMEIFM